MWEGLVSRLYILLNKTYVTDVYITQRLPCTHTLNVLSRALLPKSPWSMFEPWVHTFGREMIILSSSHPMVSGFYKMLATCFKVCKLLSYFKVHATVFSLVYVGILSVHPFSADYLITLLALMYTNFSHTTPFKYAYNFMVGKKLQYTCTTIDFSRYKYKYKIKALNHRSKQFTNDK